MSAVSIPLRLRQLRKQRGWTLERLQQEIHQKTERFLSISYLSELERYDSIEVSLTLLSQIAQGYGMSVTELLSGTYYAYGGRHFTEDRAWDESYRDLVNAAETLGYALQRFQERLEPIREAEFQRRARRDTEAATMATLEPLTPQEKGTSP